MQICRQLCKTGSWRQLVAVPMIPGKCRVVDVEEEEEEEEAQTCVTFWLCYFALAVLGMTYGPHEGIGLAHLLSHLNHG